MKNTKSISFSCKYALKLTYLPSLDKASLTKFEREIKMTGLQSMNSNHRCRHIRILALCLLGFTTGISNGVLAEKGDRLVPANPLGGSSTWQTDIDKNKPAPAPQAAPATVPAPADTATTPAPGVDPSSDEDVKIASIQKINDFFNNLTYMEGAFLQTDSSNDQTKGKFYVKRPGRIRFDYDSPSNLRIVSDGKWLSIEDPDLSTYDRYPLENTPFRMLLKNKVDLTEDADIIDFFKGDDLIIVTLVDKSQTDAGKIKLSFSTPDTKLKEWVITDQQGLDTRIEVADLVFGKEIGPGFFVVNDNTLSVFHNN